MSKAVKYRMGTLRVREGRDVTEYYECAAWHKTVRCEPGEYPVYAYLDGGNVSEAHLGHTLYASFEGKVTSACFVNRIGACYGGDRGPEMIGRRDNGSVKLATYDLHRHVRSGDLILDPGLVREDPHMTEAGKRYMFYRLAVRPERETEWGPYKETPEWTRFWEAMRSARAD